VWAALPILLLAAGFFAWKTFRVPDRSEPLQAVALTTLPGAELYPTLSPDGNHVAFTWGGPKQDNPDIYVQQIGAGAESARGIAPRAAHRTVRKPLDLHGSCDREKAAAFRLA